mmetsp:Transcript_86745/g.165761  ORF Transcript_86745/g.165761 Transcript_86745/m.165761 type:complete len:975 (-) Transcript_86745:192-3116(-)
MPDVVDVTSVVRCKDQKKKSFKELANSDLQLVHVATREVQLSQTQRQLEQFLNCMVAIDTLVPITPGKVDDQDAQNKWTELRRAINSMKEAVASSKEKDGTITVQMNQAVDVWGLLKQRLEPYTRSHGLQLNPAVIDLELNRLKEVNHKLGVIAQEVRTVIEHQKYDETDLLNMFPSGVKGDETLEKMYKEINDGLNNVRDELNTFDRDEEKLVQDLDNHQVQRIAEEASYALAAKKKQAMSKCLKEVQDDLDSTKDTLKNLQQKRQKAQQELAQIQATRNVQRVNAAMELEMGVASKMQQDRKWLEDQRRILQMKLLGHSGSTQGEQHIIFILDKSGSMSGNPWHSLRSAFDSFIQQRKAQGKNDFVTVVLFHHSASTIVACQPLQNGSLSLPVEPDWGATSFSAGWRMAQQQDTSARRQQNVGRTMVVFMTDGCTSPSDVQAAASLAKDMSYNCGSNMVTFGLPLGGSSDRHSVGQIVAAGNGGRTSITIGDVPFDPVLYASQTGQLATMFGKILTAGVNIEEDVKKKMKLLEEEEKRMKESKEKEMKEMQEYFEMQKAHQDARIEAASKPGASQEEALVSERNFLEKRVKDLQVEVQQVDSALTNAEIPLKSTTQHIDQIKKDLQKLKHEKGQKEKELKKETDEKEKQIRKKHFEKAKQLEDFKKKLGTADPEEIVMLRSAVTNFSDAKRELRVQLQRKLSQVEEIQNNVSVFQQQIERLVKGEEKVLMNPRGKASLCEQWYDSHFDGLELLQGHEQENFVKISKQIMGEAKSDLEREALDIVLRCRFTMADFFPNADEEHKGVMKRLYKRCEAKVAESANFTDQQVKVDSLEEAVTKLEEEIEDEEDSQVKAEKKQQLKTVKIEWKEATKKLKVDEKTCEKKAERLEDPIKWVLETTIAAVENPFLIFQDAFMQYRVHQLLKWSEDGLVSVVKSYQMLTDGLTNSPLAIGPGSPVRSGGYPKATLTIKDA